MTVIRTRKIKYRKASHQMYEQNNCNKFLNHMTHKSALEMCGGGTTGSERVVNVVQGLQRVIILQTHKTGIIRLLYFY